MGDKWQRRTHYFCLHALRCYHLNAPLAAIGPARCILCLYPRSAELLQGVSCSPLAAMGPASCILCLYPRRAELLRGVSCSSLAALSPARCFLCSPRCDGPREEYSVPLPPWRRAPTGRILLLPRCLEPSAVYFVLPLATCRYLSVVLGTSTQRFYLRKPRPASNIVFFVYHKSFTQACQFRAARLEA